MADTETFLICFASKEVQDRLKAFMTGHENPHICAYHEVKKNQPIAIININRPEEEQQKLDQEEIDSKSMRELADLPEFFKTNEQITKVQKSNKEIHYISAEDGLVRLSPDSIMYLEGTPAIAEDVGTITGDINYSGNLICRGHIKSTSKVTVGGNLQVVKTVEDHVKLNCAGDLEIGWGASGKNSVIHCQKDCSIGYLEKSLLVCDGNVEIKAHSFMAKIFCRGSVKVMGVGISSKKRGAVVGGIINSLNSIYLKSVGAEGCVTKLIAGIDLRVQAQLDEAKELHAEMERVILISQQEIETYLSAAGSAEKLGTMNDKTKATVRKKLVSLKKEQQGLVDLQEKIKKLEKMLHSKTPKNVFVSFEDFLDPVVNIQIMDQEETYKSRIVGMSRFKHVNGEISKVL